MSSRLSRYLIAFSCLVVVPLANAQEASAPSLESQPEANAGEQPSASDGAANPEQEIGTAEELTPVLQGIESALRDLEAEQHAAHNQGRDEHDVSDLKAQEDMAFWAKAMFWATLATVAVAAVGIVYVRKTLMETRRIGQAQVRAYLSVSDITFSWKDTGDPRHPRQVGDVRVDWVNSGQSPARAIHLFSQARTIAAKDFGQPIPDWIEVPDKLDLGNLDLAPGAKGHSGFGPTEIEWLTAEETSRWLAGEVHLLVYSAVKYRDVFDSIRTADHCDTALSYPALGSKKATIKFASYPHHNRSD